MIRLTIYEKGRDKQVTEFPNIEEAINANPDLSCVYIDEKGNLPLHDFQHPKNALYIFGKAGYSPWHGGVSVYIETEGRLWPHQAACIVLYDRMMKHGGHDH